MVRNEEIQTNILVSAIELDNFEKTMAAIGVVNCGLPWASVRAAISLLASTSKGKE